VTVEGTVISSAGAPVAGAMVMGMTIDPSDAGRELPGFSRATSDAEGHFRLQRLQPGQVRLSAYQKDEGGTAELKVRAPATGVVLKFGGGTTLSGRVVGDEGKPLPEFQFMGRHLENAEGRFQVPGRPGKTTVAFDAQGYAQHVLEVTLKPGANDIGDVVMSRGVMLEGTVVDEQHAPLENALVDVGVQMDGIDMANIRLSEARGAVRTGIDGRFHLRVDPHSDVISAAHPEFLTLSQPFTAAQAPLTLTLKRGATLSATVLRADGQPAATQRLRLWAAGPGGSMVPLAPPRAPERVWRGGPLAPGTWLVKGMAQDFTVRAATVEVTEGSPVSLTLHEAADGVEVTVNGVSAEQGVMLVAGTLTGTWSPRDFASREVLTARDGHFHFVHPGAWSLVGMRSGESELETETIVVPLQVGAAAVTVDLPTTGWAPLSP
jgi:hypothetical protein